MHKTLQCDLHMLCHHDYIAIVMHVMWMQDRMVGSLAADEVFPHFIAQELPAGMAGVVISGALAAAMSSLDSSLNAISSVVVVDFAQPLCPACSDTQQLRLGRFVTAATTVLMVCIALLFRAADKTAMFDLFNVWTSVFTGAAFSLFVAATLGGRVVDNKTALISIVVSLLANFYLALSTNGLLPAGLAAPLDSYWTNVIVNAVFICTAALVGMVRCSCCRGHRGGSSRYGEFKLVKTSGYDDSEESEDDVHSCTRKPSLQA